MSVWFAVPSARPTHEADAVLNEWTKRGYKVAVWVDGPGDVHWFDHGIRLRVSVPKYPGYAVAVNGLIRLILDKDRAAEWIVTGGDDVLPESNRMADSIAMECVEHFEGMYQAGMLKGKPAPTHMQPWQAGTWGVMQPTGDRWGDHHVKDAHPWQSWPDHPERCMICGQGEDAPRHMGGAYIDRVAGSPWIGRQFASAAYAGQGPYWPEYTHMGVDEELQAVAMKLGVFHQRADLTHFHKHWGRGKEGHQYAQASDMPEFLKAANTGAEWDRYKAIFKARKAAGFPGHEPL